MSLIEQFAALVALCEAGIPDSTLRPAAVVVCGYLQSTAKEPLGLAVLRAYDGRVPDRVVRVLNLAGYAVPAELPTEEA